MRMGGQKNIQEEPKKSFIQKREGLLRGACQKGKIRVQLAKQGERDQPKWRMAGCLTEWKALEKSIVARIV